MDTSKEYIKMCEKAVEIQKEWIIWNVKRGDFYFWINNRTKTANIGVCLSNRCIPAKKADIKIWLPRQDQLQEMMNFNYKKMGAMHYVVLLGCQKSAYYCQFNSVEQLWLAFVMKEKYQKQWNGEEWIKCP